MTGPEDPAVAGGDRLRAAQADREQVIRALKDAFVHGRLTRDELDARAGQALTARTYADLAVLTADLPASGTLASGTLASDTLASDTLAAAAPAAPAAARPRPLARAAAGSGGCLIIAAGAGRSLTRYLTAMVNEAWRELWSVPPARAGRAGYRPRRARS